MTSHVARIARSAASSDLERARLVRRLLLVVDNQTVLEIALATGHHRETVRRYVAGQWPSAEFLADVCRAYNVNGDWLLTGRGKPKGHLLARKRAKEAGATREQSPRHAS